MRFNDLSKKISYNTYLDIEKYLLFSGISLDILSLLGMFPDEVKYSAGGLGIATGLVSVIMHTSGGINHTKEIKNIKKLYQELISNYNRLNKVFALDDPIQIHTMFNYLINQGYLSTGKRFEFSAEQAKDIKAIMGANVITGKGVCRHVASMLTDILNDYNIESGTMDVCIPLTFIDILTLKELKELKKATETKEKFINRLQSYYIMDEITTELIMEVIENLNMDDTTEIELLSKEKENNAIDKIFGNHAITYAYKDGKSYYLDPTQDRIYRQDDKKLSDSKITISPIMSSTFLSFNYHDRNTNMKKRIKQKCPSLNKEEQAKMQLETLDICTSNTDIFEQFYKENEELYNETSNMVLSLNENTFIKKR